MGAMKTDVPTSSDTTHSAPSAPESPKRLYRSRENKVVKGVAGGVGEYFNVDPVVVRLAFLFMFALGGAGFFAYVLAAVLMPKRPKELPTPPTPTTSGFEALQNRSLGVWVLIGIGAAIFVDRLDLNIIGDRLWPLLLIGGGLVVLMRRRDANAIRNHEAKASYVSSPMSTRGSTSATLLGDVSPTRRDLQAEALAELHDPVVDEVERAVNELRQERLGAKATLLNDTVAGHENDARGLGALGGLAGAAEVGRRFRGRQTRSMERGARRRTSRLRRFVIGCLIFFVFLLTVTAFLGLRIVTRGAGERDVTVVTGTKNFSQTFGAGDFTLNLSALDAASKGKVSLDFGQLTVTLPSGPNRPQVEINSQSRIVIAETGLGQSTEVFFGNRTRTIPGCGRNAAAGRRGNVETVKLDIAMLAGNVDLVPAGDCPPAIARR